MKPFLLACALGFAFGPAAAAAAAAAGRFDACSFESDYDLRIAPGALILERSDGAPGRVVLADGTLQVDGRELALSRADRARVRDLERRVRALVPEVKAIAIDAVALAAEAITQVAASFSAARGSEAAERLRGLSARLIERIEQADDTRAFGQGAFERELAAMTAEIVPSLVAEVAAGAVSIALSGDAEAARRLEARAQRLERELEQAVEQRARELEARAAALCPRLAELDRLESALEARVAGAALDLLQVE